nr:SDR family oxidoreductase [Erwinia mallotivora]
MFSATAIKTGKGVRITESRLSILNSSLKNINRQYYGEFLCCVYQPKRTANGKKLLVAIVTGGSRGIGLAIVHALIAQRYQVIIADLIPPASGIFCSETEPLPRFVSCDISDSEQVQLLVKSVLIEFDAVHVLVNNAGIVSQGNFTDISNSEWQRVFSINVEGPFMLSKAVLSSMQRQQYGRIINISSVAAQTGGGFLGNSCYGASKGAILSMTKGIAREYGKDGITCNAICPGFVETQLTSELSVDFYTASVKAIPAARPANPDEIARAVCFLASPDSAYLNGVTLNVDGGLIRY